MLQHLENIKVVNVVKTPSIDFPELPVSGMSIRITHHCLEDPTMLHVYGKYYIHKNLDMGHGREVSISLLSEESFWDALTAIETIIPESVFDDFLLEGPVNFDPADFITLVGDANDFYVGIPLLN